MAHRYTKVKIVRLNAKPARPYVLRWRGADGRAHEHWIPKPYRRSAPLRAKYAAKIEAELNGMGEAPRAPRRFSDAVKEFLAAREVKGLKPSSLRTYRLVLGRFERIIKPQDLAGVTARSIERYLARRNVSGTTRRRDWVHVKAFFNWAVRLGHIDANPAKAIEPPRARYAEPFAYTEEQAQRFVEAARKRRPWVHAAIRLAITCGFRISELAALKASDIDWKRKRIRIPAQKSASDRLVGFDDETGGLLQELQYRRERILWGPPDVPIVTEGTFRRRLTREIRDVCREARVPEPKKPVHDLRRTVGTILARAGTPLFVLQEFMGHKSIQTTRTFYYARDAENAATRALQDLSRAVPGVISQDEMGGLSGDLS